MKFSNYRYLVFGVLGTAYILVFFHRLSPAVLAVDMMNDLQASGALMGILASAYFYPYALMQIPAGLLADSWGPRRSATFFFIFAAAGSAALALSQSVGMAISARVIVGLGVAIVFVPTMKILTNWFEPEKYVRMTGILMALGGVGGFTAATPLAFLSEAITWRGAMLVVGALTLAIAAAIWLLVRDTPQEKGFSPMHSFSRPVPTYTKLTLWRGMAMVIKEPRFWAMAMIFFLGATVSLSFSGLWGGPFLMHVYGMSKPEAGAILSMMAIGLICGAPSMSLLSDKIFRSRKKVLMANQLAALCLFSLLAFFTGNFNKPLLYIWCFSYTFMISGAVVVGYSSIKELFPLEISGTATGLINIFPFAGAALGQPLMGWYLDYLSGGSTLYDVDAYSTVFKVGLLLLLGAFISSTLVKETFPNNDSANQ
ncbi:MAG TPA: MFS transporter [Deltaproteobacteria bacterium]|nr:MFS transporter [Deltaproteobacteria bacterium]